MMEMLPGGAGTLRRRGRGGRAWVIAQAAVAALLAATVLGGGLEIHPANEASEPLAALAGHHDETFFQGASHPVQPAHAENATPVQRPICAVCLNRLNGFGAQPGRGAALSIGLADHSLPPAVAASPLLRSLRPDGARAPPFA